MNGESFLNRKINSRGKRLNLPLKKKMENGRESMLEKFLTTNQMGKAFSSMIMAPECKQNGKMDRKMGDVYALIMMEASFFLSTGMGV